MLVVIAIIGLLSSIVLVSVSAARTKAQNTATVQNVRQFQNQLALYSIDNNGYPNPTGTAGDNTSANYWYCVGASSCTVVVPGYGTINATNQIAYKPSADVSSGSLFSNILGTQVFASTYSIGFKQFNVLPNPFLYLCTVANNPCPENKSWIYYPQTRGVVVTYIGSASSNTNLTTY